MKKHRRLTPREDERISDLYIGNVRAEDIMEKFDISKPTIYRALERTNTPLGRKNIRGVAKRERAAKVLVLFNEGMAPVAIAKELNVKYSAVITDIGDAGINLIEHNRQVRAQKKARAIDLNETGWTNREIAKALKVSLSTVDNFLAKEEAK